MQEQALFIPIRRRLVAWILLVVSIILLLLGTTVYLTVSQTLMSQVDADLLARNQQVVGPGAGAAHPGPREGYNGGSFVLTLSSDGQVQFNPQQVQLDQASIPLASAGPALATVTVSGEPTRILVSRERDGDVVISGESLQPEVTAAHTLLLVLVAGGGFGLLLTMWAAWFLAGRALVPIQSAFRRQQEFVADASHELRTPLTVLRSATDLLYRHRQEPLAEQSELLEDVRSEISRMELLAQDLLTLARSDQGELQLMTAPMDVAGLASDVARRMAPLAEKHRQTLAFASDASDALAEVDPERLQQVLVILIDNAIKYTPDGGRIDVQVHSEPKAAVIEVSDQGRGIAPEHLPRLFDRFYRGDAARSRATGGTGLGLAIAKLLVDAHGAELTLSSTVGSGTCARVRLPLGGAQSVARESGPGPRSTLLALIRQ